MAISRRAGTTIVTMTPPLHKLALTAHVTSSIGWLGAVGSFLALAIAGLIGNDDAMVRAVYVATEVTTWVVIVPLAFASLLTGLVVALGTHWGLFRHDRVFVKLMLTVLATVVLLLHTQPIGRVAAAAREGPVAAAGVHALQIQLVGDAGAALLALLVHACRRWRAFAALDPRIGDPGRHADYRVRDPAPRGPRSWDVAPPIALGSV